MYLLVKKCVGSASKNVIHLYSFLCVLCCILFYFTFSIIIYPSIPSPSSAHPAPTITSLLSMSMNSFSTLSLFFLLNPSTHFFLLILHHLGFNFIGCALTARGIILICARQLGQQHMKIQKYYII